MHILYIITQGNEGGAQKYVLALAKHFRGIIASGTEAQTLFDNAKNLQLTCLVGRQATYNLPHLKRNINPWHDVMAIFEIRELIKKVNPDIVHLNSSKAGVLGSFASMGLKTKIVFTAHGFIYNEPLSWAKKLFYLALEKIASEYRDYIICVSDADKTSALENQLISANKISTIYNGINVIHFLPKAESQAILNLPTDKIIIGTIVNFYKTKGLDILIESIFLLSNEVKTKIQIIIIGSGPEFKNLKLKIKDLKLESIILTPGSIDNASLYLKALDIFVLSSRKEGFPYVILEAMQAGLPIIATSVGGVPEALGNAGILVNPENPKLLANEITNLITNAQKQKTLSIKAIERAKLFTEAKMLSETQKIYYKI